MYTVDDFPGMADIIDGILDTHDIWNFPGQPGNDLKPNILTGQIRRNTGILSESAIDL